MKKLTESIQLIDLDDLLEVRKIRFEGYLLKHFSNAEIIEIEQISERIKNLYNSENYWDMITVVENYKEASKRFLQGLPDSLSLAFSMITLYKDEDQLNISEEFHNIKIDSILKEGIKYSTIRNEVLNFIIRFPADFRQLTEAVIEMNKILSSDNKIEDIGD